LHQSDLGSAALVYLGEKAITSNEIQQTEQVAQELRNCNWDNRIIVKIFRFFY
jgi:hypothetical protein